MTCIVAIKSQGHVYVGGDSCASHGSVPHLLAAGKVWRIGEFVMGGCGPQRVNELIRYNFKPPLLRDVTSAQLDRYMSTSFIAALRKLLNANACIRKDMEGDVGENYGGGMVVGIRGEIYLMSSDFAVYRTLTEFNATGSGQEVALGALHVLLSGKQRPEDKLRTALEAAARWQEAVRAPFTVESTKRKRIRG